MTGRIWALGAACIATLFGQAQSWAQPGATAGAAAAVPADVRAALDARGDPVRGKAQFEDCAPCHRKDASGRTNGSVPRLSAQHASVIVKQVVDIRAGRRSNPEMKAVLDDPTLDAQTIADIAAYLQGLPVAGQIGKGPGKDVARGRSLYDRDCAGCHGSAGEGQAAKFVPAVGAQHYAYLLRELNLIREGKRGNSDPEMAKLVNRYAAEDLQAVSDYMAQLPAPKR